MFSDYVAPYLSNLSGGTIFSHTIGVFGVPESAVAEPACPTCSQVLTQR